MNLNNPRPPSAATVLDTHALLDSIGVAKSRRVYAPGATIFKQGDTANDVLYIQSGGVKLSVVSERGKEAIVAMLGAGDFFGEGCMAGQRVRIGGATTVATTQILLIGKKMMAEALRKHHGVADRFIAHMLARNIRIEEDLIDQLFK
jgi:CRP-like cAMP-binding protein